tara:strand:- start:11791 stop:12246 length:456 start_codon:yes stop_codon:yes gene_type:complete
MKIHENQPDHLEAFLALNERWIAEFFAIEESDRALAADPARIWREGGWIFTATVDERVVGSCALFNKTRGVYELARMAVDPDFQGQGIGRKLALHALEKLREVGASRVELLSNTRLEAAIALYRSLGFEPVAEGEHPVYARCNVVMAKQIA